MTVTAAVVALKETRRSRYRQLARGSGDDHLHTNVSYWLAVIAALTASLLWCERVAPATRCQRGGSEGRQLAKSPATSKTLVCR